VTGWWERALARRRETIPTRLALIALAGVVARILLVLATPAWSLSTDGVRFVRLAATGMEGTAFIPPLYPFFIRAVGALAGTAALAPLRLTQSILGGATILLAATLARRLAPERVSGRAATLAAALVAFAPPLLLADLTVMSESLLALLTTAWLVVVSRPASPRSGWAAAIVPGILLGLMALCRAPMLLYAVVRPALPAAPGRTVTRALAVSAVAIMLVLPWALRNQLLFGKFVPISTNGGYNFWKSFNDASTGTESGFDLSLFSALEEADYDAAGYAEGLRFIGEHPWRALGLVPLKIGHFFGLERFFFIGVREGFWGPVPRWAVLVAALLIPATQILWLAFAPVGFAAAPAGGARREILLLAGFSVALHVVFNAEARYHVPLLPAFLAAAAAGIVARGAGVVRLSRRASALCILLVLLVVAFWAYEVFVEWEHLSSL